MNLWTLPPPPFSLLTSWMVLNTQQTIQYMLKYSGFALREITVANSNCQSPLTLPNVANETASEMQEAA